MMPTNTNWGPYPCDEKQVPLYTLPDPLLRPDGSRVTTAIEWQNCQRQVILSRLMRYEYGQILPRPDSMNFELLTQRDDALDNTAIRKEIRITVGMNCGIKHSFIMLLYLPKNKTTPVPAFLGLNFKGNHATTPETDVIPTGPAGNPVGCQQDRWCFGDTIARGYASGTICYQDIHPDRTGATGESIFKLFFRPEQYSDIIDHYSVIGAWAWGLSRGLDALQNELAINPAAIAVHGHSRLGKTSLWAGATDPRFALVISNDSGCGGGALHRRKYGENLSQHFQHHLNHGVPCWFVRETENYIWHEEKLPIDQHELLAMIAPRPLAIATATQDLLADPRGEFAACQAASKVYQLFGSAGLPIAQMPSPDTNISGDISFHYRTGKHDQTPQDWAHYWELAAHFLSPLAASTN